jgi:polyisoprenoid-binding protein YceI
MSRRRTLIAVAAVAAALAVAAFAVWWFVLRSTAPPAVSLDEAVAAASSTTTPASGEADVSGSWAVVGGNGSFAGYRVNEELANLGFQEAAGRSTGIVATLTIADGAVVRADVTVDTTRLVSDQQRRDGAIRDQALETRSYPTASFSLTEPIGLPAGAASGDAFAVSAVGDLTLHGVTRSVTIDLQAQLVGDTIAVVGSTPIVFADYGIAQPRAMVVLSVDDHGLMEFQLLFERA